jgi:hypothetical protein
LKTQDFSSSEGPIRKHYQTCNPSVYDPKEGGEIDRGIEKGVKGEASNYGH